MGTFYWLRASRYNWHILFGEGKQHYQRKIPAADAIFNRLQSGHMLSQEELDELRLSAAESNARRDLISSELESSNKLR